MAPTDDKTGSDHELNRGAEQLARRYDGPFSKALAGREGEERWSERGREGGVGRWVQGPRDLPLI